MEEYLKRPVGRRFWEEEPAAAAAAAAALGFSPPIQQQHQQQQQQRDVEIGGSMKPISRPKISAALAGVDDGGVINDVRQGSSELNRLVYRIEDASYNCPDGPVRSLGEPGKTTCWKGGQGDSWVLLKLQEKALLSFLRVRNRSTSEISISISVGGKRRRDFVQVKRGISLAHGTVTDIKIGHLPCVFIRLDCRSRGAGGVSLHELVPVGMLARCVGFFMGPCMEDLTYKSTERLLFGPSLRTSLAPVCQRAALERLVLPPLFLRPAGGSFDARDPDPVRKGPVGGGGGSRLGAYAHFQRHRRRRRRDHGDRCVPMKPTTPSPTAPPAPTRQRPPDRREGRGGGRGGGGGGGGERGLLAGRPFMSFPGIGGAGVQYFSGDGGNGGGRGGGRGVDSANGFVSFGDDSSPAWFYGQRGDEDEDLGGSRGGRGGGGGGGGGGSTPYRNTGTTAGAVYQYQRQQRRRQQQGQSQYNRYREGFGGVVSTDFSGGACEGRGGQLPPSPPSPPRAMHQQQRRRQLQHESQSTNSAGSGSDRFAGARTGGGGGGRRTPFTSEVPRPPRPYTRRWDLEEYQDEEEEQEVGEARDAGRDASLCSSMIRSGRGTIGGSVSGSSDYEHQAPEEGRGRAIGSDPHPTGGHGEGETVSRSDVRSSCSGYSSGGGTGAGPGTGSRGGRDGVPKLRHRHTAAA